MIDVKKHAGMGYQSGGVHGKNRYGADRSRVDGKLIRRKRRWHTTITLAEIVADLQTNWIMEFAVFAKMIDYLRKVSKHVTIGRAYKHGEETPNYFLLSRAD